MLTLSLVVRKVSVIAISPDVRRLLIKVLTVFEAFQQTAYEPQNVVGHHVDPKKALPYVITRVLRHFA